MLTIKVAGENALILYIADTMSATTCDTIAFYTELFRTHLAKVIIDIVPAYTSIMLSYDVHQTNHEQLSVQIHTIVEQNPVNPAMLHGKRIELPVYYDPQVGLDLARYLHHQQLDLSTLIRLHTERTYRVHAVGFSPGFAYLGELPERLSAPRLSTPRISIPAGSVGIAERQTAVYPMASAGGWQVIGRCPIDLSLTHPDNLTRFQIGDTVVFRAISQQDYLALGGQL